MTDYLSEDSFSRIDKLFVDAGGVNPHSSLQRRSEHFIQLHLGDDVADSYVLQLAVLTMVNLASRCFPGAVAVYMSENLQNAPSLVAWPGSPCFGSAVATASGGRVSDKILLPSATNVVFGDASPLPRSLRVTFDGWRACVGPTTSTPRLSERPYCSLAGVAAGALAVAEIFYDFAQLNVEATRRQVGLSLWRHDRPISDEATLGKPIAELPAAVSVFGLGHLGQAYLWALASLPYANPADLTLTLCDDDIVKKANIETGAVFTVNDIGLLKTRVNSAWLESRGFKTRLIERRVDVNFRRTEQEPVIALSGFDDNEARQWLSAGQFARIFDSGLGGSADNFDTISYHSYPNSRPPAELWPVEKTNDVDDEKAKATADQARTAFEKRVAANTAYQSISPDQCGRLLLAGKSVAVPFVGAIASCVVVSELLKMICEGPKFGDLKMRLNNLRYPVPYAAMSSYDLSELGGVKLTQVRNMS